MTIRSLQQIWNLVNILVHMCLRFAHSQECHSTYTCHYKDTEGVSTLFREFPRPLSTDHSCLWYCTRDPKCEAVTHDRTLDICRFHFEADNIPCLQMVSVSGKSLWVITEYEHHNAQCSKVIIRAMPVIVLYFGAYFPLGNSVKYPLISIGEWGDYFLVSS